jgi:hypothetical protein
MIILFEHIGTFCESLKQNISGNEGNRNFQGWIMTKNIKSLTRLGPRRDNICYLPGDLPANKGCSWQEAAMVDLHPSGKTGISCFFL